MKKKRIIIIVFVILLIVAGAFITIKILGNKNTDYDFVNATLMLEDYELPEEEKKKRSDLKTGEELYNIAVKMYQMKPYCGVYYENINKKELIKENNKEYYNSSYTSTAEINNEINKYFSFNKFETITDYIEKDGYVYCEYKKRDNSENYLGEYYLDLISSSDSVIEFTVNTSHLAFSHDDVCSVDNYLECTQDEKDIRTSKFVIEKVNGIWKIKEFHNPYELSYAF